MVRAKVEIEEHKMGVMIQSFILIFKCVTFKRRFILRVEFSIVLVKTIIISPFIPIRGSKIKIKITLIMESIML